MGEPGYFETLSPRFHVDFSWSAEGAIPARAPAFVSLHLVVQGVGAHPWRIETDLANATGEASRPLPLGAWVDVPAAAQRLADQGHDKETSTWTVVARVSSAREGAVGTREFVMPIEHEPPLYVLPSADRLVSHVAHGEPEVRVHETRAGVAGIAHAPGAVALALGGILTLLVLVRLEDPA
jgi:hypothetical protein